MFRKLFAVLTLVLALPVFANAAVWTVKASSANPTFGTVSPQGYNYYQTSAPTATFTVAPVSANYQVSAILVDNVDVKSGNGAQSVTVNQKLGTTILVAKFAAKQYSVTAVQSNGGTINSTTSTLVNAGASKSFTILPAPGKKLISVNDTAVGPIAVTSASGMIYTISDVQADHVVTAVFGGTTANAGAPQNAVLNSTVTLKGSGAGVSGSANYAWTVVYAPVGSAVTSLASVAQPTFTADKIGTYNFKLTVTDAVDSASSAVSTTSVSVYADVNTAATAVLNQCIVCHTGNGAEFTASNHWTNARNLGVPSASCAAACHFKSQTTAVACNTCHASNQFSSTGTLLTPTASGMEAPVPTAQGTCFVCHSGSKHGAQSTNFLKSSHNTGAHAKLYYNMDKKACVACHNPHSTEAAFFVASTATTVKAGKGCEACHRLGSPYGIYNADGTGKAPHFGGPDTDYGVQSSFITTGGATCSDCHGHNNTINAGWAEGGHGDVNAIPWKSDSGHIWNAQGTDGVNLKLSPQKTNCIRCHTSRGFKAFVDSGFTNINKIYLADGVTVSKASAPLTCDGCHTSAEGALRLANFTTVSNGAKGYKVFYGYSTTTYATKKLIVTAQLGDNKNSNLCMPCHSQRTNGELLKAIFANPAASVKNIGSNVYPHDAQPGSIFYGKGGYEYTSAASYVDRARHQRIGNYGTDPAGYNNTGNVQGSCVGCHYNVDPQYGIGTHALEAVKFEAFSSALGKNTSARIISTTCAKCHPSTFTVANVEEKKDDFNAAVKALEVLLIGKGITQQTANGLTADPTKVLQSRVTFDMSLGTGDATIAEKNAGAWYNWFLFSTADKGAYAHNPSYARRLIFDSIDWLDDAKMNGSSATTIVALSGVSGGNKLTVAEATAAAAFTNDPGCLGCHYGTGSVVNGTAVPGIEEMPHYNDGTAKTSEGLTQAQFVVPGTQCNYCHGIGHGTDSPSYSAAKTAFPNISAVQGKGILANYAESAHGEVTGLAWTHYDFKQADRADCSVCHTTKGFISGLESANANGGKVAAATVWGTTGDTTKQVLGCNTCHSSTTWSSSVRTINGGYVASMGGWNKAQALTFGDVGESNVCIPCHASRENGDSIKANVLVANTGGFKNPHYLAAAATFYGKGGFRFYGATDTPAVNVNAPDGNSFAGNVPAYSTEYGVVVDGIIVTSTNNGKTPLGGKLDGRYAAWSHGKLGMDNYTTNATTTGSYVGKVRGSGNKGQCVACHLGPTNTHTFDAFEVANATMGTSTSKGCFGCHNGEDMKEVAETEEFPVFSRMMAFFQWNLQKKGMYYNAAKNPYFFADSGFTTNFMTWGATLDQTQKTMGAAQNFKLLDAEKGAHVHNRSYMRQLVFDSIQYLQFGAVTYSNSKFYGTTGSENLEDVLKFSEYSTVLAATPDQIKNPDGSVVSIQQLKNYIISSSSRTNPIDLTTGVVPGTATYGAIKFFRR